MTDKCRQCKYCKESMDTWTYMPFHYCFLNKKSRKEIDECERYKDKYTIADYFSETAFGWFIVLIIIIINIILHI